MKRIVPLLLSIIVFSSIFISCGESKTEKEKYPYDGIHEWYAEFSNPLNRQRYREELGCEIKNGKVVRATWYTTPKSSPLSGTLDGNILRLEGNDRTFKLPIKFEIDLRTMRGTVSSYVAPNAEAKFRVNN